VKKQNPFEFIFHDFVTDFGGEVLPEVPDGHTADYLFPKHNIIAELKSLTVDQTENMNRKLTPAVMEWIKKSGRKPVGVVEGDKYMVEIKDMPPEIQDVWLKWLKSADRHFDSRCEQADTRHEGTAEAALCQRSDPDCQRGECLSQSPGRLQTLDRRDFAETNTAGRSPFPSHSCSGVLLAERCKKPGPGNVFLGQSPDETHARRRRDAHGGVPKGNTAGLVPLHRKGLPD